MQVSFSKLSAYKQCPKMYEYKARGVVVPIDLRRFVLGEAVGQTMETFYRESWWCRPDVYALVRSRVLLIIGQLTVGRGITWEFDERSEVEAKAVDAVTTAVNTVKSERLLGEVNSVEVKMSLPVVDLDGERHEMVGRADFIIQRGSDLVVLDGKTGSAAWAKRDQLRLYALMVERVHNRLPTHLGFWYFRTGAIVYIKTSEVTLRRFLRGVSEQLTSLKRREFEARPSPKCRTCDYRSICREGGEFLTLYNPTKLALDGSSGVISFD